MSVLRRSPSDRQSASAAAPREPTFCLSTFSANHHYEYAEGAAEAAESVGAQGKFWEMHDTLFQNQPALDYGSLLGYAEELELDLERFATEPDNHVYAPRVREDFISGVRRGVNGTPTFFINGVRHEGAFDFETMLDAIQTRMTNLAA
ncbi:MAG TPA: DsbA family protein [Candidatus Acidoferrum sp.]|nr:DsbA family protein [Candidatus Acidoferrum sp.]